MKFNTLLTNLWRWFLALFREPPPKPKVNMFKVYTSYDGTSNEMGRLLSQDHDPINMPYWGGRVRCKRFFIRFRAPTGGYSHVSEDYLAFELPARSLVLGGYFAFQTAVAGFDGAVIRLFPHGNGVEDELVFETGQAIGFDQDEAPKVVSAAREYFPGTAEWQKVTYATAGAQRFHLGAAHYVASTGSVADWAQTVMMFRSPTAWHFRVADTVSMLVNESYTIDGFITYVSEG